MNMNINDESLDNEAAVLAAAIGLTTLGAPSAKRDASVEVDKPARKKKRHTPKTKKSYLLEKAGQDSEQNDAASATTSPPPDATAPAPATEQEKAAEPATDDASQPSAPAEAFDPNAPLSFPEILYKILSDPEYHHIVSWLSHGKGFVVHDRARFASEILPKFFDGAKFTSFTRRLKRWHFDRVARGSEMGAYYNKHFLKDRPELVRIMMYCMDGTKVDAKDMREISEVECQQRKLRIQAGSIPPKRGKAPSEKTVGGSEKSRRAKKTTGKQGSQDSAGRGDEPAKKKHRKADASAKDQGEEDPHFDSKSMFHLDHVIRQQEVKLQELSKESQEAKAAGNLKNSPPMPPMPDPFASRQQMHMQPTRSRSWLLEQMHMRGPSGGGGAMATGVGTAPIDRRVTYSPSERERLPNHLQQLHHLEQQILSEMSPVAGARPVLPQAISTGSLTLANLNIPLHPSRFTTGNPRANSSFPKVAAPDQAMSFSRLSAAGQDAQAGQAHQEQMLQKLISSSNTHKEIMRLAARDLQARRSRSSSADAAQLMHMQQSRLSQERVLLQQRNLQGQLHNMPPNPILSRMQELQTMQLQSMQLDEPARQQMLQREQQHQHELNLRKELLLRDSSARALLSEEYGEPNLLMPKNSRASAA